MRTSHHIGSSHSAEEENGEHANVVVTQTLPPSIVLLSGNSPLARPRKPSPEFGNNSRSIEHSSTSENQTPNADSDDVDGNKILNAAKANQHHKNEQVQSFEFANAASTEKSSNSNKPPSTGNSSAMSVGDQQLQRVLNELEQEEEERGSGTYEKQQHQNGTGADRALPHLSSTIIVACLAVVAVVSSAVFVGLCVARQRQLRLMTAINANAEFSTLTSTAGYMTHRYNPAAGQRGFVPSVSAPMYGTAGTGGGIYAPGCNYPFAGRTLRK